MVWVAAHFLLDFNDFLTHFVSFQAEWEALEICDHHWALEGVEDDLTGAVMPPDTIYIKNKFD